MPNILLDFWSDRKFDPFGSPPYLHPVDREWFRKYQPNILKSEPHSFASFIKSVEFGTPVEKQLHLSLLPAPFSGDISKAEVYILLMNPGFSASDYYAEEVPAFRSALVANLHQKNLDSDFPYFSLNPKFAWSGAFQWMESRFRPVLQVLKTTKHLNHHDALSFLSKQIAVIELIPYHSSNGQALSRKGKPWVNLPSAVVAKQYVKQLCESPKEPLIMGLS